MSFQFNIEDMKTIKINELVQNPIVITLYIILLAPMFTYAIFHTVEVLKGITLDDINFKFIKSILVLLIGFISICTAIKIAVNIAEVSYNFTKNLYTALAYNNLQLFNNIFNIIFIVLYISLFALVLFLPIDISLFITILYILCNSSE